MISKCDLRTTVKRFMADLDVTVSPAVWRRLYAEGKNDLRYPNDVLVRLGVRLLNRNQDRRILDFGFGTGANLAHFASQGFEVHGVEISEHALARAKERLRSASLTADLRLIGVGERLPYIEGFFDVVYSWQVIYYNNHEGWRSTVAELERVTRKGGLVIIATAAPGDASQIQAQPLGNDLYRSNVPDQEGCIVTIPDRERLGDFFPGRSVEIGEFGFQIGATRSRYWIVNYRTRDA
jgi:SAM-dependent methyltransferase